MKSNDILLVTFPVDLGNRTLESNQHAIFKEDMDFYRFADGHATAIDSGRVSLSKSIMYRFRSASSLRKVVRQYSREGKKILFNGLSPALFSYGLWKPENTSIVFDWTRTLYPSVLNEPLKKDWVFKLHQKVLKSCPRFLCWTDAIMDNLQSIYEIESKALFKVPAPFLIENLSMSPRPTPAKPRVLFVGGDLLRKGGDILIKAWQDSLQHRCSLSMMTNDTRADAEGINFLPNIRYGSEDHRKAFHEHDILILPTRIDAYPQVIGEAAAAGLAVITSRFALGAGEVIENNKSGYISDSPEACIHHLEQLLQSPRQIDEFKAKGFELMQQKFSRRQIRQRYLEVINGSTR